jgi:hypothetical protein
MDNNPLGSAIQKMGGDFLVASFVPSMAFIVISSITFDQMLPDQLRYLEDTQGELLQSSLSLLLFTTILGFTLYTLSTYIYKSFEGYTSILKMEGPLRRSFMRRQMRRFKNIELQRMQVEKELAKIQKKIENELQDASNGPWRSKRYRRYLQLEQRLKEQRYDVIAAHEASFPPAKSEIMPTRFGNILKAAETYPVLRYKIDAVQLWGRLAHVIPASGMEKLDHASNQSLFLLNSSLLAGVFIVLCFAASIINTVLLYITASKDFLKPFFSADFVMDPDACRERLVLYIALSLVASGATWIFYEASLLNVSQFGDMIRSSYDLYRFELLKALHLKLPNTLVEERQTWMLLSQFMVGNDMFGEVDFEYEHQKNNKTQEVAAEQEDASLG